MRTISLVSASCTAGLLFLASLAPAGDSAPGTRGQPLKPTGSPTRARLNVNQISTLFTNDGYTDGYNQFVFPKGTGKTAICVSGLLWGLRYGIGGEIRVGGSVFGSGLQPGQILPGMVAEDGQLSHVRMYRVRRDIPPGERAANIDSELKDGEGTDEQIYAQYEKDWQEWPSQYGAPYEDKNQDGVYDPATDVPGVQGAHQTLWYVANDLDVVRTLGLVGCQPVGMEMQQTAWAYARQDALGYTIFRRYVLINKSTMTFDSLYVSLFVDPDLGGLSPGDDVVGCDTTRSLGFVYNSQELDQTYAPLPPPAVGFDFFQGPVVPGTPTDSAVFMGRRVYGKRNMPMTAFYAFVAGNSQFNDPQWGSYNGALELYRYFQGRSGTTDQPYIDPNGVQTFYPFAGDPVSGTGWLDGKDVPPGDRRMGIASGPLQMAPGDTQEVVLAVIAAGAFPGSDRLKAVALLKSFDDTGQRAYDNLFAMPSAPPGASVTPSEQDGEIILSWGDDPAAVAATEGHNRLGYAFQGYNVYQLPTSTASLSAAKRLATYDVIDGVTTIYDTYFDAATGTEGTKAMQFGTDSGIKRAICFTADAFNDGRPLVNGNPYYFAVTTYSHKIDPIDGPSSLESVPSVIRVVPHSPDPGSRIQSSFGDSIGGVTQITLPGHLPSDGVVTAVVVDPQKVTGHTYSVTFDTAGGRKSWSVIDLSSGAIRLGGQTDFTGSDTSLFVDGFQVSVRDCQGGPMRGWSVPSGRRVWAWKGGVWTVPGVVPPDTSEGFNGAIGNAYDHWFSGGVPYIGLRRVLIKYADTDSVGTVLNPNDPNVSFAFRYMRNADRPPAKPSFAPFIVRPDTGYAYQDYKKCLPLAAYDVDVDPPTRLMVGFLEFNYVYGRVDGKYWPPDTLVNNSNNVQEFLFIFATPYSETPDPRLQVDIHGAATPMMWLVTATRNGKVRFASGDEFLITTYHYLSPANTFQITSPKNITGDVALAKQDVAAVNVFPNPYYGVNPQETDKYQRFVTFSHLPQRAIIRIFNLAGVMVRRIDRAADSQFERWDLKNQDGLPVGSGLYIAHIEMPDIGVTKVLKLAIIQEQQILDAY